jgi:hypothetical protein
MVGIEWSVIGDAQCWIRLADTASRSRWIHGSLCPLSSMCAGTRQSVRVLIILSRFPAGFRTYSWTCSLIPHVSSQANGAQARPQQPSAELHGGVNAGYGQLQVVEVADGHGDQRRRVL